MKKKIKNIDKLLVLIIFNIAYIFFGSFFVTFKVVSEQHFSFGYIPLLVINGLVGLFLLKKNPNKRNIVYFLLLLLVLFGIISTVFAFKPNVSLFGYKDRYEGLFSLLYYYSLMILSSFLNKKYQKIVLFSIIITGLIQCFYGIIQINGEPNTQRLIHPSNNPSEVIIETYTWAFGFLGNPNFFGTYMLLCLSCSIGLFMEKTTDVKSLFFIMSISIFMYGLLISNTLSCIVGLFIVIAYLLIYSIKSKSYKKFSVIMVVLIFITITTVIQGKTTIFKDLSVTTKQSTEIAKGNGKESYGTNRVYIWKSALKVVPKNIITGVGIDNFAYAFNGDALYSPGENFLYDKAHNEFLQILITEGIFALITYVFMISYILYKGIKNSFINKKLFLILPVIGYLVQAFFNISVIEVAPVFFIILGLVMENNT